MNLDKFGHVTIQIIKVSRITKIETIVKHNWPLTALHI